MQYVICLWEFQLTKPFTPVALVKFRKRFNIKRLPRVNEVIVAAEAAEKVGQEAEEKKEDDDIRINLLLAQRAGTLIETVESCKARHGYYPESVLIGQIYRNRETSPIAKSTALV